MRLQKIRPLYFRCYGDSDWIHLNSDLVILFGPNGYGKSSLVESIEWLLHGRTKRRQRGQELSKRDYKNYYQHAHASVEKTTAVEAEVLIDEKTHTIRRELHIGDRNKETTETFVDGNPAEFASIGLQEDPLYDPVIPQHALQDFLLSRPKERRDKVSAAFGLDPLVQFSEALGGARRAFQSSKPDKVRSAERKLGTALSKLNNAPDLEAVSDLREKWSDNEFNPAQDKELLVNALSEYLDADSKSLEDLEETLRETRSDKASRVFNTKLIRPPANWETSREEFADSRREIIEKHLPGLREALQAYSNAAAAKYSNERLQFWKQGLKISDDTSDICPMCEAETLNEAKRNEIVQRIEDDSAFSDASKSLKESASKLARNVRGLSTSVGKLFPQFVEDDSRSNLKSLFKDDSAETFLETHDATQDTVREKKEELNRRSEHIGEIPQMASDPEQISDVPELLDTIEEEVGKIVESVSQSASDYATSFESFEEKLQNVISDAEEVKEADAFLAVIDEWEAIDTLAAYHTLLQESLEVERNLKEHLQKKQEQLFKTRGKDIDQWYEMMNPAADVTFSHMETGATSLHLFAEAFGEELNAASALSQCQANCLGLSIHLMRTLSSDSPFDFIVLDDPVQSMDDDHYEALKRDVVEQLLEVEEIQLIVTSHMRTLTDDLNDLYYRHLPLYQRISDLRKTGPEITDNESVADCIKRATHFSEGNEEDRRLAVDIVRRAVEKLMRKVCRRDDQDGLSVNDGAKEMLNTFRKCSKVKSKHEATLRDTINFSNSAHHDDPKWSVPKKPAIRSHLSTLSSYRDLFDVN